ncbi:MAG: tolA [Ramlibacter sp.]|nr:tolA [Ramlibacter sp.]
MNSGFFGHAADAQERLAFAPPPQPGLVRAFALAVFAHLLLLLALMHGLQWKRETQDAAAEAELWSAVPQQAAPREVVPPPPAPPPPPPPRVPVVKAPPPPPVVKAPEPPPQRDADIAVEREKHKREQQKKKLAEERALEKKLQAQQDREERRKLEAQKKREEELARRQEEAKAEKARLAAEAKAEKAKLAAADARRRDDDKRRKQEQDTQKLAQMREDNLRRIQGMAGSGEPSSGGSSAQSSGPSKAWGARVVGKVRPNIVFSGERSPKWSAEVELRLAPDGTIVSRRIVKSSAPKAWDEAVLRALDKTETLPRDTDGRMPSHGILVFTASD